MSRNQTLINEWKKTTNLSFLINDIFTDIDNASYFFGRKLEICTRHTDNLFTGLWRYLYA